jgi:hypothetical protein
VHKSIQVQVVGSIQELIDDDKSKASVDGFSPVQVLIQ